MLPYIMVLEGLPIETAVPGVIILTSKLDRRSETVATGSCGTQTTQTRKKLRSK